MNTQTLLADPAAVRLDKIISESESLMFVVATTRGCAECPRCGAASKRIHSRYVRTVADLPCHGIAVRLQLRTRRFRCVNDLCTQSIFCERLPSVVARYARRTVRLTDALELIAFALGGRPGARLSRELAMPTSRHTLLHLIRRAAPNSQAAPSALGIDDWAKRKGKDYGTILVDLERHRVLDLLPDRTAETSVLWLQKHPDIEVISRDRASAYAEAITKALPHAVQVADRWHLLKNATEMLDRLLQQRGRAVRETSKAMRDEWSPQVAALPMPQTRYDERKSEHRARRLARYEEVIALRQQGAGIRAISRHLHLSRNTVKKYVRAEAFPERRPEPQSTTIVDPFTDYLAERWNQGCRNASQLWRELRAKGFTGGHNTVWEYLKRWRTELPVHLRHGSRLPAAASRPPRTTNLAPRAVAWLLQQDEASLRPDEQRFIAHLYERVPELATATKIVARFRQIIREQLADNLDDWLAEAIRSGITELRNFAEALQRDYKAVKAALEYGWSQGQTEGQVNRLKNIKRQMFGRAKFDLLRARVLHAT